MKVFFEIQGGSSFEIEVYYKDTVLEMKKKIEKSQRVSVSKQTLIFDGTVLQDDLDIEQYKIVHESRLQLFVSPDHNPNQTDEQSPSSNPTEQIINAHQDSTVTVQTEQSPSSNSVEEMITNIQDSSEKERIPKKRIVVYVLPYSGESQAVKEVPVAVNVKMNDNVKELRNELVKIEENGELNLPQEGYFLIHKNRVLNENQSFWVVGVDHNDTIEILPTHLTRGSFNLDS
ncbi:Ubiquitin-like domain superfamily [Arabidopsis thaliana x Arabidopsis arenosa]|uniref:Ubiquitin-like domain superfamily n=1 Tax=Arabidopsis thaliana x Arabidopsis arenosa TaxID=1240361 RepID=A0A8T1Z2R1_9BRAS|nr:Ubiquitin-like domain superfamily [Arabidopsis thaliana x Arabidopsis arenosa]